MNQFIVPETGEYRLWTYDPARREIHLLAGGVVLNTASSNLPNGEPTIEIVAELAKGTVVTTKPGNAPFTARTLDGTVVYENPR